MSMSASPSTSGSMRSELARYARVTRSGTYGFLAALPLLAAYEILILLVNHEAAAGVRVGADVWIKQLLASVGATSMFVVTGVVLVTGIAIMFAERSRKIPIKPAWFGWMLLESIVYAVIVAIVVSRVVTTLFYGVAPVEALVPAAASGPVQGAIGLPQMLALSLGAGIYEELVFRVILVGGLAWLIRTIGGASRTSYLVAALFGAAVFSAVHYIGAFGDPFTFASFTFRFLFGLALNGLYLARGFGVAAWTHALYDVMVVTHLMG